MLSTIGLAFFGSTAVLGATTALVAFGEWWFDKVRGLEGKFNNLTLFAISMLPFFILVFVVFLFTGLTSHAAP